MPAQALEPPPPIPCRDGHVGVEAHAADARVALPLEDLEDERVAETLHQGDGAALGAGDAPVISGPATQGGDFSEIDLAPCTIYDLVLTTAIAATSGRTRAPRREGAGPAR
jgi:hypothetical protein